MYLGCFFLSVFTLHQVFKKVVECIFQLYKRRKYCKFSVLREVTINMYMTDLF